MGYYQENYSSLDQLLNTNLNNEDLEEIMPNFNTISTHRLNISPSEMKKLISDGPSVSDGISEDAVQKISKDKLLTCPTCSRSFGSVQNLNRHISLSHEREEKLKHGKKHQCNVCQRGFTSEKNLTTHQYNVHYGPKRYQCNYCPAFFKKSGGLVYHMQQDHDMKKKWPKRENESIYRCTHCEYSSNSKTKVFQHMERRHDVDIKKEKGPFRCDGCTKIYQRRHTFLNHIRDCPRRK